MVDGGYPVAGYVTDENMSSRTAVNIPNDQDFFLNQAIWLTEGKAAVTLINPAGELAYQSGYLSEPEKESPLIPGMKCLWIVIRDFAGDGAGRISGSVRLSLHQSAKRIGNRGENIAASYSYNN